GIRDFHVTGVQTCALPISAPPASGSGSAFSSDSFAGFDSRLPPDRKVSPLFFKRLCLLQFARIVPNSAPIRNDGTTAVLRHEIWEYCGQSVPFIMRAVATEMYSVWLTWSTGTESE